MYQSLPNPPPREKSWLNSCWEGKRLIPFNSHLRFVRNFTESIFVLFLVDTILSAIHQMYNTMRVLQIYILQVWRNSLLNKGTPIKISRQKKQLYIMPHFTPLAFLNSFVKGSRIFMYWIMTLWGNSLLNSSIKIMKFKTHYRRI